MFSMQMEDFNNGQVHETMLECGKPNQGMPVDTICELRKSFKQEVKEPFAVLLVRL